MRKIAIIAGNHEQYLDFIRDAFNKEQFVEADRFEKVLGMELSASIEIGTCYDRKDYYNIKREVESRIR